MWSRTHKKQANVELIVLFLAICVGLNHILTNKSFVRYGFIYLDKMLCWNCFTLTWCFVLKQDDIKLVSSRVNYSGLITVGPDDGTKGPREVRLQDEAAAIIVELHEWGASVCTEWGATRLLRLTVTYGFPCQTYLASMPLPAPTQKGMSCVPNIQS